MPKKIQVDSAPPITMPAKVDVLPAAPEASEEPKQEEKQPDESEAIQNMEYPNDPQEALAVMIIKLTDSMNRDVDPADFVRDNMMGKIDREMLIQLSSLPAFALVQNICSPLESDHPLQDARGKSYIKDVLAALKVGLTEE